MGEIADDMICGFSCSWCGIYFQKEHGYPVICKTCFKNWREENPQKEWSAFTRKLGVQLAKEKEM